jgi:DNA-binding NarL/FixJ family response regulator
MERCFVVDAIAKFERTVFEGEPIRREEKPEYRAAQFQHARAHEQSSSQSAKRQAIMRALATDMTHAEIAREYGVSKSTVHVIKKELDGGVSTDDEV